MKKILVLAILFCLITAFAFSADFTVQTINGTVQKEVGSRRAALSVGETLDGDTVIRTAIGASLVLKNSAGEEFTIPAGRNGKIEDLINASGAKIGGITRTDTDLATRTTGQTSTASARASDQAGDDDIAAE